MSSPSSLVLYADDILLSHVISSPSCMASVQSDLDLIAHWINSHLLSLNPNKCKYMVISRKSSSFTSSLPSLSLAGVSLEQVQVFKYLGVVISSRLSWSDHVLHVAAKARKSIGVIYRNFYRHFSPATLLQLYKSIVLPQLTYCSSVWAPSSSSGSMRKLESVQHFALKVCLHQWNSTYSDCLHAVHLPSFSARYTLAKLTLLYKIKTSLVFFPSGYIHPAHVSAYALRHQHSSNIFIPFFRTAQLFSPFCCCPMELSPFSHSGP